MRPKILDPQRDEGCNQQKPESPNQKNETQRRNNEGHAAILVALGAIATCSGQHAHGFRGSFIYLVYSSRSASGERGHKIANTNTDRTYLLEEHQTTLTHPRFNSPTKPAAIKIRKPDHPRPRKYSLIQRSRCRFYRLPNMGSSLN